MMDYVLSANQVMSQLYTFWQCQKTQSFIKSVIAWLSTYDIDCHISEKYFILGWQEEQSYSKVLKFIILYAKYYIYITRCKKQSLPLLVFK